MCYRWLLRPLLFLLSAERAHRLVFAFLRLVSMWGWLCARLRAGASPRNPALRVNVFGRELCSPIGLAAGLDKDAEAFEALGATGIGFIEVGTLTAKGQPGNPSPRVFRLPSDRALINRMGFNNHGAPKAALRLAHRRASSLMIGANIGRTKTVENEHALADYAESARILAPYVDYLVLNVSSPNTPGLRALQNVDILGPLVAHVRRVIDDTVAGRRVPLLLKISPDLADEGVDAIGALAVATGLDGLVATNTTIRRDGLQTSARAIAAMGAGGLSGAPLKARSLEVLRRLRRAVGPDLVLVSVGGIETAEDAWERLQAGATLVQVYTAFVYQGPSLLKQLHRGLVARMRGA